MLGPDPKMSPLNMFVKNNYSDLKTLNPKPFFIQRPTVIFFAPRKMARHALKRVVFLFGERNGVRFERIPHYERSPTINAQMCRFQFLVRQSDEGPYFFAICSVDDRP